MKKISIVAVLFLFLTYSLGAMAQTTVPAGTINSDQQWTAADSPYLISGDVTVLSGVTLTIAAGCQVEFAPNTDSQAGGQDSNRSELRIEGDLQVNGTDADPAVFTSQAASPSSGDFYGIVFLSGGTGSVNHAQVQYALHAVEITGSDLVSMNDCEMSNSEFGLWIDGADPVVSGGSIYASSSRGVYITNSNSAELSGISIHDNANDGIYVYNSNATIHNCSIFDNNGHGLYLYNSLSTHDMDLIHNTIAYNTSSGVYYWENGGTLRGVVHDNVVVNNSSYGMYSYYASVNADHNLVWGNGTDYHSISPGAGSLSENPLFANELARDFTPTSHSPSRLHASDGLDMGAMPYAGDATPVLSGHFYSDTTLGAGLHLVQGDLTVEPGVTLTIAPGAELRFAANSDLMGGGFDTELCELRVLGRLQADGTQSVGIIMDADSASPSPGDWYGVWLSPSSNGSILDFVTIGHAYFGVRTSAPSGNVVQRSEIFESENHGIFSDTACQTIFEDLLIRDSSNDGVYVYNSDPIIRRCRVSFNNGHGIYVYNSTNSHDSTLERNTVVQNSGSGFYFWENGGTLSATLQDNISVDNGSYGAYSYYASVSSDHNLVWGNSTDYHSVSAGTGSMSENPLFVDELNGDFRITSNSPARLHASDGGDMGALSYSGNQTVGLRGHLYENTTWLAADGPFLMQGDITVEPGVSLEIDSGSQILATANNDDMGGNESVDLVELRVLGRLVIAGTSQQPVSFASDAASPSAGDWYGLHFYPGASSGSVTHAIIDHAIHGIWSQADQTNRVELSEVHGSESYGLMVGPGGSPVFDGLMVANCGDGGVYITNADADLANMISVGNTGYGFYLYNSTNTHHTDIRHATVADNQSSGIYAWENGGTLSVDLRSSIVVQNSSYGLYSYYASFSEDYNNVWANGTDRHGVSTGSNSRSDNPNFVNTSLLNYRLLQTSGSIDQGDPASPSTSDADGATRPIDGNNSGTAEPDMGAYEYNPDANKWPIAEAGPDRIVQEGETVTFDGTASYDPDGSVVSYSWDFGDGQSDTGAVVQHAYTGGADHTVTLTVTDDDGAIDVDTAFVEVNLAPVANTGASDVYEDVGVDIRFDGSGSVDSDGTITRYDWDFGNGDHATGAIVFYQYSSSGDYTVTLTVTDDDGGTDSATMTAHVLGAVDNQPPQIVHQPITNGQAEDQAVLVQATVTDNIAVSSVTLFYRTQGQADFIAQDMPGANGSYSASIPASVVQLPAVEYYILAEDTAATPNIATDPDNAPTMRHSFTVADVTPPDITHDVISGGQPQGQPVVVTAIITDPSGLASVSLHYRLQGTSSFVTLAMTGAGDTYSAIIPGGDVQNPGMEYYIQATDSSPQSNIGTYPDGAPASVLAFSVQQGDESAPSISVTQIPDGQDEDVPVEVEASITDSSGVHSATLYYRILGGGIFASAPMVDQGNDMYTAQIPAASIRRPGVEYYVEAVDSSPAANSGTSPADAPDSVFTFTVVRDFQLSEGDLVITEIMANPDAVSDTAGEWFEIYNTTAEDIDLNGIVVSDNDSDSFTIDGQGQPVTIAAGGYLVLGRSADEQANGGVPVDYVYASFTLANNTDEIILWAGDMELDRVEYDSANFPIEAGASMGLDPDQTDSMSNDNGENWCLAKTQLSGGDFGTPGQQNDSCAPPQDLDPPTIVHSPISDGQPAGVPVSISADVSDESGLGSVLLYARVTGQADFSAYEMTNSDADHYQADIPANMVTIDGVEYYIEATDASNNSNTAFAPAQGASAPYSFAVTATDQAGPTIQHTPPAGPLPQGQDVLIQANVTDPSGVASVTLEVKTAGIWGSVAMTEDSPGVYVASIPGANVQPPQISYYLSSVDASPASNGSSLPEAGQADPFVVTVENPDEQGPVIEHTPVTDAQQESTDVSVTCRVTDDSGVDSVWVYFRIAGTNNFVGEALSSSDGENYAGAIPAALVQKPGVDYYLEATDGSENQNVTRDPVDAPSTVHSFLVAGQDEDTDGPVIVHTPIQDGVDAGVPVSIDAQVSDESGVSQVVLYYRAGGENPGDFNPVPMELVAGENYTGIIPAAVLTQAGVDYYIEATDDSDYRNVSRDPAQAPELFHSFVPASDTGGSSSGGCGCGSAGGPFGSSLLFFGLLGLLGFALQRR